MAFDGKQFGAEVVGVVKDYLERNLSPIVSRLDALERRLNELPVPKDGKDADEEAIASRVTEKMAAELAELRKSIEAIEPAPELPNVAGIIEEAIASLPKLDPMELAADIDARVQDAVSALPPAQNGKDADLEEIRGLVVLEVERAVAAIPRPQDGKSVTIEELRPLVEESVSAAVSALPKAKDGEPGKDGVGLAGAVIDRDGNLILTLTDGTTRDLGLVVGKDGEPGKPGLDGFSLSDFSASLMDDGRTVLLSFEQEDVKKSVELGFPAMIYRGVYKEGQEYQPGDTVTWGGSLWHCDDPTTEKPDGGKSWTLAAKRGRDGKDGVLKAEKPKEPVKVG